MSNRSDSNKRAEFNRGLTARQAAAMFVLFFLAIPVAWGVLLARQQAEFASDQPASLPVSSDAARLEECLDDNRIEFGILAANSLEGNKVVIQHNNVTIYTPDGKVLATGHLVKPACVSVLDGAR